MDTNSEYKVTSTKRFSKELNKTYKYISKKLYSKNAANQLMLKIHEALIELKKFPKAFCKVYNSKYRKMIVENYIILYEIKENKKQINVVHIFHKRNNYIEKL